MTDVANISNLTKEVVDQICDGVDKFNNLNEGIKVIYPRKINFQVPLAGGAFVEYDITIAHKPISIGE